MKTLATVVLALAVAGCGKGGDKGKGGDSKIVDNGGGGGGSTAPTSGTVKIVSSLPRTGSANAQTTTITNGIRLAIEEAGGKAGNFNVEYEDWDDASAKKGDWDP